MSGLPPDPTATGGTNLALDVGVTATPLPPLPVPAQATTTAGTDQFLRKWSLVVTGASGSVLELSAGQESALGGSPSTTPQGQPISESLALKFRTYALDTATPNHMEATVYNLSDATAKRVTNGEFDKVILQAGYVTGKYGVIFSGTIKQVKRGRQSPVDTMLVIYASDGDIALSQIALDPIHMQRGSSREDRFGATVDKLQQFGVTAGPIQGLSNFGGILPREKIIWGMANQNLDQTSKPLTQWSIQNGVVQCVPIGGYLPGEVVILNSRTGLVGIPEATQQGVFATALLNPAIKVRGRIKINNADINDSEPAITTTQVPGQPGVATTGYPSYVTPPQYFASTAADGTYIVIYLEYEGETRGSPWYVHIVCLLMDQSSNQVVPGNDPGIGLIPGTDTPLPGAIT